MKRFKRVLNPRKVTDQEKAVRSSIVKYPNIRDLIEQVEERLEQVEEKLDNKYLESLKKRMQDIDYTNKVMSEIIPNSYEELDSLLEHQILKKEDKIRIQDIYEKITEVENNIIAIAGTVSEEEEKRCIKMRDKYKTVYPILKEISTAQVNSDRASLIKDNKDLLAVEEQLKIDLQRKLDLFNIKMAEEQLSGFRSRVDYRAKQKIQRIDTTIKQLTTINALDKQLEELLDNKVKIIRKETANSSQNIEEVKQSQETEEDIHATLNPIGVRLEAISRQIKRVYKDELIDQVALKKLTKDEELKEIIDISNEVSGFLVENEIDDNLLKEILNVKNKVEELKKNLNSDLQLIENYEQFYKIPTDVRTDVITKSLNLLYQKPDKEEYSEDKIAEIEENINEISEILEKNKIKYNNDVIEALSLLNTRLEEYKKDLRNELQRRENENLINNLSDGKTKERLKYISDLIDNKGYKQIIIDKAEKGELGRYEIKKHINSKIDALIEFSETCEADQPEEVLEAVTSLKNRLELLEKDIFQELKILDEARILKEAKDSPSGRSFLTQHISRQIKTITSSLEPLEITRRTHNVQQKNQISKEDAEKHVLENFVRPEFYRMTELYYRNKMLFEHDEQQRQEEILGEIEQFIDTISNTDTEKNSHLIGKPEYKNQQELQKQDILSETADYNFLRRNDNVRFNSNTIDVSQGVMSKARFKLPLRQSPETQATNKQSGYKDGEHPETRFYPNREERNLDVDYSNFFTLERHKSGSKGASDSGLAGGLFSDVPDVNESVVGKSADIGNSSQAKHLENQGSTDINRLITMKRRGEVLNRQNANLRKTVHSKNYDIDSAIKAEVDRRLGFLSSDDVNKPINAPKGKKPPSYNEALSSLHKTVVNNNDSKVRPDDGNKVGPNNKVGPAKKVLEQYDLESRNFQQKEEEKRKAVRV